MNAQSMNVSHDIAAEQAVQLYRQNVKYSDIAAHLKKIGYVSSRTRKPITDQAARWMVMEELKKRGESPDRNANTSPAALTLAAALSPSVDGVIKVGGEKGDLLDSVRIILGLDIASDHKLKLVKALVS
jgi:hypothetical protein